MFRHHAGNGIDDDITPPLEPNQRVEMLIAVCQAKCSESGPVARLTDRLDGHFARQEARDKDIHDKINATTNRLHWLLGGAAVAGAIGLAAISWLGMRIGSHLDVDERRAAIVQVDKSSAKADNPHLIGTAQAAPSERVAAPAPTKGK